MNIHHKSVYYTQVVIIYAVCIACLINLSIGTEPMLLWSSLLCSAIGYIIPGPQLKTGLNEEEEEDIERQDG